MPIDFPKTLEEVSKATVEGTVSVLNACKQTGVRRLILTSHYGAINMVDELDRPDVFDESTWSDLEAENFQHIHKSKTMAEKAAWDFVKTEYQALELVTLVPTLLVGPSLMTKRQNISGAFLTRMLKNQLPGMYRIMWGMVDVRDAARAHVAALTSETAVNQRIIIHNKSLWCRDIGLQLSSQFGSRFKFSTEEVKFCMMRFLGSFFKGEDAEMTAYKSIWGKTQEYDNKKSRELLGMEYGDVGQSLKEQIE